MRYLKVIQYGFLLLLLTMDLFLTPFYDIFPILKDSTSYLVIIGIIVLSKTEYFRDILFKISFVSVIWSFFHMDSFFLILTSNLIAVCFIELWNRHIGNTPIEILFQTIVVLVIKAMVVWVLLPYTNNIHIPIMDYFTNVVLWNVILNILWIPFVIGLNKKIHQMALQRTQNLNMR